MNVGIDLRPLSAGESGGLVTLVRGLAAELFSLGCADTFTVFTSPRSGLPFPVPSNVNVCELDDGPPAFDTALARSEIDVLLRAYPTDEPLAFPPAHEVTIVPDLLHADRPDQLPPETVARRAVAFARAATCGAVAVPSLSTLAQFQKHFPTARATPFLVPPVPPRLRERLAAPLTTEDTARVPGGPFFLYPAHGWPHKNHAGLLRAWERFRTRHPHHVLVLTGTGKCVPGLLAAAPDPSVRDLGYVSDRLLAELYDRATALVFPSLYEGFGLPLLEAFDVGRPVLCGNTSALSEVGGDAVLAVDATNADALAAALERLATDPDLRAALATRGRARHDVYAAGSGPRALLGALTDVAARAVPPEQVRAGQRIAAERLAAAEADRAARLNQLVALHDEAARQRAYIERREAERATEYDRLFDAPPGPLVSVVVTMGDTRGAPERCVRAWTQEQTFPRDRIEVIVGFDGKKPDELEQVKRVLGPTDRVVHVPTDSESGPWAAGARHARGRWLYFAEAHSYGEPECLEEMIRYLVATRRPGASSRSLGLGESLSARLEERLYDRVKPVRVADDHWSKLFLRGAALEREVYHRVGGLQGEYGRFSEPLLAARLHRAGYRLGYAPRSIVRHWNTTSFAQLEEHVHDYATCECAFRLTDPDPVWDSYFGTPTEWARGGRTDPALARVEARVRLGGLLRGAGSVRELAKLLPACVLGGRWWRWPAASGRVLRKLRVHLMEHGEARTDAFAALWQRYAAGARLDVLTRIASHTVTPRESVAIDEFPAPLLVGFHPLERYGGLPFRWAEPLAHVKLALPPGEQIVELVTRELRPPLGLEAFVNGRRAPVENRTAEDGRVRVTVHESARRTGLQYLTLKCVPWSAAGDTRALGLPLFGLRRAVAARQLRAA
ncbi:glycosyltransferase [Frigoriglobus tundricola]|uniref:GT4 family glycosyltransferase n=1 Tax=Frigoriglobus tundricola TaxID=2774151 RepID=A0A6M5YPI6_9BACT|nr:glycosyltransferase [Frigoriglobus tundricola]QJW94882.1 GT4 family glycosyltransferase [Frigoriglobus tundricola]